MIKKMDKTELLHYALTQYLYLKNYEAEKPKESYDKVRKSFERLFKKILEYWNDLYYNENEAESTTVPIITTNVNNSAVIETDPVVNKPIRKDGNPHVIRPWREQRNENIKRMYIEATKNNIPVDEALCKRIAQVVGSTSPKVREIINVIQFNEI